MKLQDRKGEHFRLDCGFSGLLYNNYTAVLVFYFKIIILWF
jgi:hypothetical protein